LKIKLKQRKTDLIMKKIYFKYLLIISFVTGCTFNTLAQTRTITFTFDATGNRTTRTITLSSKKAPADSTLQQNQAQQQFTDELGELKLSLSPNPTKGLINLRFQNVTERMQARVDVYDLAGRLVFSKTNITAVSEIDLSSAPHGIYILKINAGGKVSEWRVVKE
jgi:YD repeat-containing protein